MSWVTTNERARSFTQDSENLRAVFTIASSLYGKHTEWFLKHRDTVLKQLAVLITAELAIYKFVVVPAQSNFPVGMLQLSLAALSMVLAHAGVRSCKQAFQAAMENVVVVNKIIWSMAPSGKLFLDNEIPDSAVPAREDSSLYVPRFLAHSIATSSTEEFVKDNLSLRKGLLRTLNWVFRKTHEKAANTYFWTAVLIWLLGAIGATIGVSCFAVGR